jgi:acyl dehydratase
MTERFYEDYAVGEVIAGHGCTLTESAIIDFALQYDPQPFHLSVPGGEATFYGGLIASGWQVAALSFRLLVQAGVVGSASLGAPGVDALRWLRPVRPGDTLYPTAKVTEKRVSASKTDRGLISIDYVTRNQRGEEVLTLRSVQIVRRRDPTVAA